jgi:predicted aminopeptidase
VKGPTKAPSGIAGLDVMTDGGLPRGRTTLLVGGAGSGKTILALQFLVHGDSELAAIIFHELAHQLLYVKNDTEFNEAFATTVEDAGLERWLASKGHPDLMRAFLDENMKERAFIELFTRSRAQLKQLYASGLAQEEMRQKKAAVFAALTEEVRALQRQQGDHYYDSWLKEGLNNAHLASMATYYQCVPGFERLLAEQGGDLERFYAAARELSRQPRAIRHARLCQPPAPTRAELFPR